MSEEPHAYEQIEEYLEGRMTAEQTQQFEQKIAADNDFAEEVAIHRQLQKALSDKEVFRLEALLEDIEHSRSNTGHGRFSILRRHRWLAAAAVLLLVTAMAYLLWPTDSTPQYAAHFEHYPFYLSTRSMDDAEAQQLLSQATLEYEEKNYAQALPLFEKLLQEKPNSKALQFYTAYCALETQSLQSAQSGFRAIIEEGDSAYVQPAQWYLVQALLEQGEREKALQLLKQIADSGGDFSPSAQELMEVFK